MDELKQEKKSELVRQAIKILKLGIPDWEKADHIMLLIEQYRKLG